MNDMIERLKERLRIVEETEKAAKKERIAIEKQIVDLLRDELKDQGTTNLHGLKIVTGYNRKWSQEQLRQLVDQGIPPKLFPFKVEYKEDRKLSNYIENNEPEVWEVIAKALTLTPKKPSVSIIGTKNQEAA